MRLAERIPYVLTLDSDTGLPPGALRELVAVAAHPLNAPQIDAASAPRGRAASASCSRASSRPFRRATSARLFHWLFAGQCGLDPYSSGASDLYQDVFGTGSFTGKGLLQRAAPCMPRWTGACPTARC